MNKLQSSRKEIDSIDKRIILLLSKRVKIAKKLKNIKKKNKMAITDKVREKEVIGNARAIAQQHDLEPEFAEEIFKKVIKYMKEQQK
jgi:chorismate mutase